MTWRMLGKLPRTIPSLKCLGTLALVITSKKEAIKWAWELSTVEFGLPANRVSVSIYQEDDEVFEIWKNEVGVPVERIKRMGEADNFCDPCSELYYDFHPDTGSGDDTRFLEFYIWFSCSIIEVIRREELQFKKTLGRGEKLPDQMPSLNDALSTADKSEISPLSIWKRCIYSF